MSERSLYRKEIQFPAHDTSRELAYVCDRQREMKVFFTGSIRSFFPIVYDPGELSKMNIINFALYLVAIDCICIGNNILFSKVISNGSRPDMLRTAYASCH